MSRKLPALMLYTGDWMKDPAVRSVSSAARGLWIDMLCLMFESPRRGFLQYATGQPVTAPQLARMTGCRSAEVVRLLKELENSGVFFRTEDHVIYSKRMVRDEHKRLLCKEAGKLGGNPTLKGESKGGANRNSTPSISSAVSSSPAGEVSNETSGATVKGRASTASWAERIYAAYPRRVGKSDALKSIERAMKSVAPEVLLAAVVEFAKSPKGQDDRFCPHPATWFNQGRWDDDRSTWQHGGDSRTGSAVSRRGPGQVYDAGNSTGSL